MLHPSRPGDLRRRHLQPRQLLDPTRPGRRAQARRGATFTAYRLGLRYDTDPGWRVLNLWDYFPEPGWPPGLVA